MTRAAPFHPKAFVASGATAIAVSFGIGRYGLGLYLPDFARAYALSEADLGFLASAGWAGYVAASLGAMVSISALGPRVLVALGLAVAALGMGLIAVATSPLGLTMGAILTGVSPGLVFAPLADAITTTFEPARRGPAFAVVNCGEGAGAIAAAALFVAVGANWRAAWMVFCLFAVASAVWAAWSCPRHSAGMAIKGAAVSPWRALVRRRAWPLLAGAFVVGASTTILWTYAGVLVDGVHLGGTELRVILWIVLGVAGVSAVVVAPVLERWGLRRTYAASLVLTSISSVALALAAGSSAAVLGAGVIFGFAYIMVTSQIGAWAISIWPRMPAAGFGFTFLVFSAGAVLGPAAAGLLATVIGLGATLALAGAMTAGLLALLPR